MSERNNPGGGGMTGATGDLTPEAPDDQAFEPGERREVEGAERAQVTHRQGSAPRIGGDEISDSEQRF